MNFQLLLNRGGNQQNHLQREHCGTGLLLRCRDNGGDCRGGIGGGMHSLAQYLESQRSYRDKQGCKRDEKSKRPRKPEYRRVEA